MKDNSQSRFLDTGSALKICDIRRDLCYIEEALCFQGNARSLVLSLRSPVLKRPREHAIVSNEWRDQVLGTHLQNFTQYHTLPLKDLQLFCCCSENLKGYDKFDVQILSLSLVM